VKRLWGMLAAFAILFGCVAIRAQMVFNPVSSILNSKHDFRATSTATIKSVSGDDPCIFCHTPHNATPGPQLWNHTMSTTAWQTYGSSTMQSSIGSITDQDSSKLCLSCHDGTIALASTVNNGDIEFAQGPNYMLPTTSASNLAGAAGQGFTDDHPFAFQPTTQNPELVLPPDGDAVKLEVGKIQCSSCHDPHKENIDAVQGKFLVKANQGSALCTTCHAKAGWTGSAHQAPPDLLQDQKYTMAQNAHTGYVGVANNACESCHKPHTAGTGPRLLKFVEESTCYKCHDGSVTTINVQQDLATKTYRHPVDITPSVHDESEGPVSSGLPMPETSATQPRHAECADCHNSHVARANPVGFQPFPPTATAPLAGASGESITRVFLKQATNEYELCFKCHADSVNRPQLIDSSNAGIGYGRNPKRQYDAGNPDAFNTRVEFTQGTSFHPVTRTNPMAPANSLRPFMIAADGTTMSTRPLNATTMIFCSDCHASDTNRTLGAGNTGAAGPHGSNFQHLLERQSALEPPPATPGTGTGQPGYTVADFALCDKCHDVQNKVLQNYSFTRHSTHVVNDGAACSTCHDPHASQNQALVNFDLSIVAPSSSGPVSYIRTGPGHGSCTLTCHGKDHQTLSY